MNKDDTYTGRRISDKDARLVMGLLGEIESSKGRLKSVDVAVELVCRSRPTDSPTHHLFVWDDREAADTYRLDQARALVRQVYVVFADQPDRKPIRAVVNIVSDGIRGPMPLRRVLQSSDLTHQLLEKALQDLRTWSARYEDLRAIARMKTVFAAIDRAVVQSNGKKRTARKVRAPRKRTQRAHPSRQPSA